MKNIVIAILVAIILSISGWLYFSLLQVDKLNINLQTLQNRLDNFQILNSQKSVLALRNFSHSQIDFSQLELETLSNKDTLINLSMETDTYFLIAYFDSQMCSVCLERVWANFDWLNNHFSKNVILLTKGYPTKYFLQNERFEEIHDKIFILKNDITSVVDSPIYFLSNGKSNQSFQVDKNTNDTFELLKQIISSFSLH